MPNDNGWLDAAKYERIPILGCTGPGTMIDQSAWKFIGHTTESRPGTIEALRALMQAKPCYCPQFGMDPLATLRRQQYIPWTWSAAALRGGSDCGMETNRWRCVQVEICDRADNAAGWGDEVLWQIGDLIADLIKDGCPINLDPAAIPDYPALHGTVATMDAAQRLYGDDFRWFNSVGAHVIVGCNDHYDWYRANGRRIGEHAQAILAGGGIVITPSDPPANLEPAPPVVAPEYVARGMEGGIVKFGQQLLIGLGYDVGPAGADGIFGADTEAAVKQLQTDAGFTGDDVDGIIGPMTVQAIATMYGQQIPPPPPRTAPAWPGRYLVVQQPRQQGTDVGLVQLKLDMLGFDLGMFGADGIYGDDTANAVYNFQATHGLEADRVVGPNTWNALAAL